MATSTPPAPPEAPREGEALAEGDEAPQKRKATSFKITNVFLSRPPSNDGEDSCEDGEELEDSRTEDLSDITDANSLNSLSSKLESLDFVTNPVIVNGGILQSSAVQGSSAAAGPGQPQGPAGAQPGPGQQAATTKPPSAPTKPKTSPNQQQGAKESGGRKSQGEGRRPSWDKGWEGPLFPHYPHPYAHPGFGFVTYEAGSGGQPYPVSYVDNATGFIPVAGTMAVINNVVSGGVSEVPVSSQAVVGPNDFKLRFKIVKVETTEPLRRGRWTCLDFNDKPAMKEEVKAGKEEKGAGGGKTATTSGGAANPEQGRSRAAPRGEGSVPRAVGQTEPLPPSTPFPEGEKTPQPAPAEAGQSTRLGSVPPEERRPATMVQVHGGYSLASTPSPAPTSTAPPLTIALPAQAPHTTSVQSPSAALARTDFPPQATLGSVIRLPNGELAQVSLTPLTGGTSTPGGVGAPQFPPQQPQQPPVVLKQLPAKQQQQQQQVVVNAAGQQFLVQQQQGGAAPQQSGAAPPANPGRGTSAPRPQQPAVKIVSQGQQGGAAPPQQQQLQKQFSPVSGGPPSGTAPAPSMQQSVTPSSSAAPPPPSSTVTIPRAGAGGARPAATAAQTSALGLVTATVTTATSAVNSVKYSVTGAAPSVSSGGALYPALASYPALGQEGLGEGLVERLEDLVSREEEGELEHESASGAGQGSIDNRIEQAMDLVKSHLMSAVRSEVEELRDKISKLEDTVQILSRENEVLRTHVPAEVLGQLQAGRTLMAPPHLNSLPPPEPSHPALQPPQH